MASPNLLLCNLLSSFLLICTVSHSHTKGHPAPLLCSNTIAVLCYTSCYALCYTTCYELCYALCYAEVSHTRPNRQLTLFLCYASHICSAMLIAEHSMLYYALCSAYIHYIAINSACHTSEWSWQGKDAIYLCNAIWFYALLLYGCALLFALCILLISTAEQCS